VNSIIGKLSSYQILTNLLPGAFFVWLFRVMFDVDISSESVIEAVLIYYFVGFIINRVGSVVVGQVLKHKHFQFAEHRPHSDFIKAEKIDPKIGVLSEVNNCFRSFLTSVLVLPFAYGVVRLYVISNWFATYWVWFAILFLIALFFFAHKKQTEFVSKRIQEVICENEKDSNKIQEGISA